MFLLFSFKYGHVPCRKINNNNFFLLKNVLQVFRVRSTPLLDILALILSKMFLSLVKWLLYSYQVLSGNCGHTVKHKILSGILFPSFTFVGTNPAKAKHRYSDSFKQPLAQALQCTVTRKGTCQIQWGRTEGNSNNTWALCVTNILDPFKVTPTQSGRKK